MNKCLQPIPGKLYLLKPGNVWYTAFSEKTCMFLSTNTSMPCYTVLIKHEVLNIMIDYYFVEVI